MCHGVDFQHHENFTYKQVTSTIHVVQGFEIWEDSIWGSPGTMALACNQLAWRPLLQRAAASKTALSAPWPGCCWQGCCSPLMCLHEYTHPQVKNCHSWWPPVMHHAVAAATAAAMVCLMLSLYLRRWRGVLSKSRHDQPSL